MLTQLKLACILLCATCLFSSCFSTSLCNQDRYSKSDSGGETPYGSPVIFRNEIPACAMRQLLKRFPDADNINWKKGAETGWIAGFKTGAVETRMDFDAHGDWRRIYNFYSEAPAEVRAALAKEYSGYRISSVYSFVLPTDEFRATYSVVLRNEDHYKVLGLYNGNLSVFTDLDFIP